MSCALVREVTASSAVANCTSFDRSWVFRIRAHSDSDLSAYTVSPTACARLTMNTHAAPQAFTSEDA
eukprot:11059299-Alexandrium_andersonii.AAC.1